MKKIYLDYAATAPTDPQVIKAIEPFFFERFGNANSPHTYGREAQKALEDSRLSVARFIGAKSEEIIFTSGGTEANNQAIVGVARRKPAGHLIVSKIEHHSVLEPVEFLAKQACLPDRQGFKVTYLNVDRDGFVDPSAVQAAITNDTVLISVMHASNEIGTIEPIAAIGRIARERKIPLHVDAVQTFGHIPINVSELNADLLSFSAHKFYGPKGVGGLYVRQGISIVPYLLGGDQERGLRASTENITGIVGLAKAVELCQKTMTQEAAFQQGLRDKLIRHVLKQIDGVILNGHPTERLPHNAHFSFEKISGEALLMSLDMAGIAASMGSACTSGALVPSHVLRAIGLSDELALGSLRITLGRWTKEEDVDYFLEQLPPIIKRLRV